LGRMPISLQSTRDVIEVTGQNAGRALACRPKVILGAQMQLNAAGSKPCAAASRQDRRFVDLDHSQNAGVEVSGDCLLAMWHRQLQVVQALKHDQSLPSPLTLLNSNEVTVVALPLAMPVLDRSTSALRACV